MTEFGLPQSRRLRRPLDFDRVFKQGIRAGDDRLLVIGLPNELPESRCGFVVSKKNGDSVRRHRLKRLLREAYRLSRPELPTGFDWIVIPRPQPPVMIDDYKQALRNCIRRIQKKTR